MITTMNRYQKRQCASGNSISFFVQLYAFYVQTFAHVIVSKTTTEEQGECSVHLRFPFLELINYKFDEKLLVYTKWLDGWQISLIITYDYYW